MLLITRDTDYALRALCLLAKKRGGNFSAVRIAEELDIPYHFLRAIMQKLSRSGYLKTKRGREGGFSLIKKPADIRISEVMDIFQGQVDLKRCAFRNNICPDINSCKLRKEIMEIEKYASKRLSDLTIKDII